MAWRIHRYPVTPPYYKIRCKEVWRLWVELNQRFIMLHRCGCDGEQMPEEFCIEYV